MKLPGLYERQVSIFFPEHLSDLIVLLEMVKWFSKELQELQSSPIVMLRIYCTRASSQSCLNGSFSQSSSTALPHSGTEKTPISSCASSRPTSVKDSSNFDLEKHPENVTFSSPRRLSIKSGRPDIASIITEMLATADKHERLAVAACGPDSLMQVARQTVARLIKPEGPSLELHCEQFRF